MCTFVATELRRNSSVAEGIHTLDGEHVGIAFNPSVRKTDEHAAVETRVMDSQVADGDVLILQSSVHLCPVFERFPRRDQGWPPRFGAMVEHFFVHHELLVQVHPGKALNTAGAFR